jgi:hypothetical protein
MVELSAVCGLANGITVGAWSSRIQTATILLIYVQRVSAVAEIGSYNTAVCGVVASENPPGQQTKLHLISVPGVL